MVKDGRVVYLTETKKENCYWNIPIANTTVILLATGTSITQAAVRMLASAGVLIGFSGSGGTPLISGIEWFSPQSEYRPTQYVQGWLKFWYDPQKRLEVAKSLQRVRINFLLTIWNKDKTLQENGFNIGDSNISKSIHTSLTKIDKALTVTQLLQTEALLTKKLYKIAGNCTGIFNFSRERQANNKINDFLNHGNYLAYGLAATTLWVLGIPHGFAVMHGKTRRGALVFDIADLIKDALVLPLSFICAKKDITEKEFRQQILQIFSQHKALDFLFDEMKKAVTFGESLCL